MLLKCIVTNSCRVKILHSAGTRVTLERLSCCVSAGRSLFSGNGCQAQNRVYFKSFSKKFDAAIEKYLTRPASTSINKPLTKKVTVLKKTDDAETTWREQKTDLRSLPSYYMRLAKIRLSGMVVLTAMAGYALCPAAMHIDTFLWMSAGTLMCSSAANAINQWLEVPFDSQMARTKNRVLVKGLLSSFHVISFGVITGSLGILTLLTQVNGLTAFLGAANLVLYTSIYTPLKRLSIANTWVGSVVGGIPPLMGWVACSGTLDPGALVLAGILYSWQFPHFNALSWNLRPDYSRAGYRMMCVTDPALCRRVALRHSVYLIGLSTLLPVCDVTSWWLVLDSLPLNVYLTWLSWRFYKQSDSKSSRELFRFSLIHLPVLMFLIMFHKKPKKEQENIETNNIVKEIPIL